MPYSYLPLLDYISYFSNEENEFYKVFPWKKENNVIKVGGFLYSTTTKEFMKKVTETGFIFIGDYKDWTEGISYDIDTIKNIIALSDIERLRKILTYYIRHERFHDGIFASAIKDGIILNILMRLKDILT